MKVNDITEAVIGAAIEVHRFLGPGLLESAYIQCLCYELTLRKIPLERVGATATSRLQGIQTRLWISRGPGCGVKAVEHIAPVHAAQLLTYLRMGAWKAGLLINFNVPVLRGECLDSTRSGTERRAVGPRIGLPLTLFAFAPMY